MQRKVLVYKVLVLVYKVLVYKLVCDGKLVYDGKVWVYGKLGRKVCSDDCHGQCSLLGVSKQSKI